MATPRRQKSIVTPITIQSSNTIAVPSSLGRCTNIGQKHDEVDLCSSSDSEEDDSLFANNNVSVFGKDQNKLPVHYQSNDLIGDKCNYSVSHAFPAAKSSFVSPITKATSAVDEARNFNKASASPLQTHNKNSKKRGRINKGLDLDSSDSEEDEILFRASVSVFSTGLNDRLPRKNQGNNTIQKHLIKSVFSASKASTLSSSTKAKSAVKEALREPLCHLNANTSNANVSRSPSESPQKSKSALSSIDERIVLKKIYDERERHLNGITNDADKALQLLLWDTGFQYNVYAHQFEAIRFVAGLVPNFPVVLRGNEPSERETMRFVESASHRSKALAMAAYESNNSSISADKDERYTLLTKGMILADEMGLGKTIEALAGAVLRNAMMCDSDYQTLPTLIVSPQDGIQNQWYETLIESGVKPTSISIWGETKIQMMNRQSRYDQDADLACSGNGNDDAPRDAAMCIGDCKKQKGLFILCTRYNIQSELRKMFDEYQNSISNVSSSGDQQRKRKRDSSNDYKATNLFRNIPLTLIGNLRNQYLADKGKERNKFILPKEKCQDCVARLVRNGESVAFSGKQKPTDNFTFQTIIVDEAHFCKNVLAYWGLGLALLGMQSKRTVLLTGTPYNNGPSDMSTLMTYIDPTHEAAKLGWWEDAVTCSSTPSGSRYQRVAADVVSEWRKAYLLRRTKDILLQKLPPRLKTEIDVGAIPSELWIYQAYESKFLGSLRRLKKTMKDTSPEARYKMKKVFEIMMACMACMRMALVHPALPGGREMTIHFSPSRRHLLKREERPNKCVFCESDPTRVAEKEMAKQKAARENQESTNREFPQQTHDSDNEDDGVLGLTGNARTDMDLDDDRLDDNDLEENHRDKSQEQRKLEDLKKGPIVPLGPDFCRANGSRCQHYAHEKCIEAHRLNGDICCPRCHDLTSRLHGKRTQSVHCDEICTHIGGSNKGGFTSSAKIEEAIKWFQKVPPNDKAIILSFFKGSLDLIEGILVTELGIDCVRYDGDVGKEIRTKDLERFKTSRSCRVLLATVQSGGTGLNITEANHVCFLDRWFNPCVHDQAESRCHRIGQKKDVNIAYLDINFTVDVVMKRINVLKEGNASVVLADGTSLGDRWSLGYRNVSGVIGNTLNVLRDMRDEIVKTHGDTPLPPYVESDLEEKLQETKTNKARSSVVHEKIEPEESIFSQKMFADYLKRTLYSMDLSKSKDSNTSMVNTEQNNGFNPSETNYIKNGLNSMNLCKSKDSNASKVKTEQKYGINAFETKPKFLPKDFDHKMTSKNSLTFSSKYLFSKPRKIRSGIESRLASTKQTDGIDVFVSKPKPTLLYGKDGARKLTLRDYPSLSVKHNQVEPGKITELSRASMKSRSKSVTASQIASSRRPIAGFGVATTNHVTNRSSFECKRSVSSIPAARTQAPPIRNRFSRGLSAILSQRNRTKESMRRKKRGDL